MHFKKRKKKLIAKKRNSSYSKFKEGWKISEYLQSILMVAKCIRADKTFTIFKLPNFDEYFWIFLPMVKKRYKIVIYSI